MAGLDRGAGEFGPEFQGCSGIQMADFLADQTHPSCPLLAQIKMQEKPLLMTGLACGDDLRLDSDLPELVEMHIGTANASYMRLCGLGRRLRLGL